jgi:ABC-type sugar transport system, periplasmic component
MNRLKGNITLLHCVFLCLALLSAALTGCGKKTVSHNGKVRIELLNYKPEATAFFNELQEEFNRTHKNIILTISSPNDAVTVLKTRLIREDPPDIIAVGGDINWSTFVDVGLVMNISDYPGLSRVKQKYHEINKLLLPVPMDGMYGVPYVANAAGVLFNREIFDKQGWKIPKTWDEFISLCLTMKASGIQPLVYGMKDTWNTLPVWNALAVSLADYDITHQVNRGETNFTTAYREVAEKQLQLLQYGQPEPFTYGYNDACTAFARGQSAMFAIGSYAIPQILSVNPNMKINSFTMPANNDPDKNILNSGIDLQFSIMEKCRYKEEAYTVLDFLLNEKTIQAYLDSQIAVPCVKGDFTISPMLDGMRDYIDAGNVADYQDHYYPAEMDVAGMLQTFLIQGNVDEFLSRFDTSWVRYNRDLIARVRAEKGGNK